MLCLYDGLVVLNIGFINDDNAIHMIGYDDMRSQIQK